MIEARSTSTTDYSQAFSFPPSQIWDGNDGAWSTFVIRVGTPAQYFRVLPSTNGAETWVPIPDRCGNARGVEQFNGGKSGPASGSPTGMSLGSLDAGNTCTANKSPMCINCISVNGRCTNGPCVGRTCCGDPPGICNSGGCNGVSGICTGQYIGCPCPGPDYNAGSGPSVSASATSPILAQGFVGNQSSSWIGKGIHWIGTEVFLNQTAQGQYGLDSVGLGADADTGLTADGIAVVGVPTKPFFLGTLGMRPTNSSGPDDSTPSFLMQLWKQKRVPSLSYGYTAGALYKSQLGSLTLGGYDVSRLISNPLTFPVDNSSNLRIPIQAITGNQTLTSTSFQALPNNITAIIDTTTPHTWLPPKACQAFESAFGLAWDNSTKLYLLNDTTHQRLINQNPTVTFSLGSGPPSDLLNITLPYEAFDLQASAPIYFNGTNYFPIRCASNSSQYTLGRAFFQEAYLTVDYETANFSISQTPASPSPSNIVTINHHPSSPSTQDYLPPNPAKVSREGVIGISVGCGGAFLIILAVLLFFIRRHHRRCNATTPQENFSNLKYTSFSSSSTTAGATSNHEKTTPSPSFPANSPSTNHDNPASLSQAGSETLVNSPNSNRKIKDSPPPPELDDPSSPINRSGSAAHWSRKGRRFSRGKPLPPRPLQELQAGDAVDELMQRERQSAGATAPGNEPLSREGSASSGARSPRSPRTKGPRSPRTKGPRGGSEEEVERRVRQVYEMMG